MNNRVEYLTREILEELRPEYGERSIFKYIESRSDLEISKTRKTNIIEHYTGKHRGIFPIGEDTELITDMDLYHYSKANDPELYLKLLPDYVGKYVKPILGRIPKDLAMKILHIAPEYIDQIPLGSIDSEYYINYCLTHDKTYHRISSRNKIFKNEEFLFFYKHKHLYSASTRSWDSAMVERFLAKYPEHVKEYQDVDSITHDTFEPAPTYYPPLKMSKEEFMDKNNIDIPSRIPAEMLSDEEVVLKIISISSYYMTLSNYRSKFVTKEIFDKVYMTQPEYFCAKFAQYFDTEMIEAYTKHRPKYRKEFHDLYTIECWRAIVERTNSEVLKITDNFILRDIVYVYPELEQYLPINQIETMISLNKKSARS